MPLGSPESLLTRCDLMANIVLRQITLSKIDEICPLAIPNQISLISIHIPSLVKIP